MWRDDKQKCFTPLGFSKPRGKCKNSSFAGGYHRVAIFHIEFIATGLTGYITRPRCVNCGRLLGHRMFMPSERREDLDRAIENNYKE